MGPGRIIAIDAAIDPQPYPIDYPEYLDRVGSGLGYYVSTNSVLIGFMF